jgi:hypothetical protein
MGVGWGQGNEDGGGESWDRKYRDAEGNMRAQEGM